MAVSILGTSIHIPVEKYVDSYVDSFYKIRDFTLKVQIAQELGNIIR